MGTRRYRHWVAALLSFLQPGLGHAYLRSWGRALLWFLAWLGTVALVANVPAVPTRPGEVVAFLVALAAALEEVALGGSLVLAAITAFATLDAYWLATRRSRPTADATLRCPNCRQELDRSLEFCPWCAEELDGWIRPPGAGEYDGSEA